MDKYINKIINADCLDILKQLPNKSIDLVLTDPPYLIKPNGGGKSGLANRSSKMRDEIDFIANDFDFELIADELLRISKIPNIIMFCSNLQLGRSITYFENKGLKVEVLIWSKSNPAPLCNGKYISDIEYILYIHTKGSIWNKNAPIEYKRKTKIYPIVIDESKIHPTQKPIKLINEFISLHSLSNDLVLDCFSGSGTTAIASHRLNRRFICIEKDKDYYNASVERLENEKAQLKLF